MPRKTPDQYPESFYTIASIVASDTSFKMECRDVSRAMSIRASFYAYAKSLRDAANGLCGKYSPEQALLFKDKAREVSKIIVTRKENVLTFSDRDRTGYGDDIAQAIRKAGRADLLPPENQTDEEIAEFHPIRT